MGIEAVGWAGSAILLAAYAAVSLGWLNAQSVRFQCANIVGAGCLAANAWAHDAIPLVALEGAWAAIALATLGAMAWRRRRDGENGPAAH